MGIKSKNIAAIETALLNSFVQSLTFLIRIKRINTTSLKYI